MNRTIFFVTLTFFVSFAKAGQREQIIQDFITGTSTQSAILDEMFGADVQLINHYLFWQNNGHSYSLDIELLQKYFQYYLIRTQIAVCESPSELASDRALRLRASIPQSFMDSMQHRFQSGVSLYSDLQVDGLSKSEVAVYEMCQFSLLSYLSMPFDPAGLGGLNRNFEFENAFEINREICIPITQQILEEEFNRSLTVLRVPEDMPAHRMCRN